MGEAYLIVSSDGLHGVVFDRAVAEITAEEYRAAVVQVPIVVDYRTGERVNVVRLGPDDA